MPAIDLTKYVFAADGSWCRPEKSDNEFGFTLSDTMTPERLMLRWSDDFIALQGPLRVRITVQAENLTLPLAFVPSLVPDHASALMKPGLSTADLGRLRTVRRSAPQASTIYSYILDIPAGEAWPFKLADLSHRSDLPARHEPLGNNLGLRVLIEPAFSISKLTPVSTSSDLPCDFAVADRPDSSSFFPVACEPCDGNVIGLPPTDSVSLVIPPAEGGCVRTRFFNGMFITREDLETEQRYHRLKSKLHNRASGAGVVWGLGVGLESERVCVLPGYGVDCCGNDLALTSVYHVDVAALLADPAAARFARQRDTNCLQLLLEYVECPSDPRPVHGDPCLPESSRCEMSRIRESVRLRLVPPRHCDPTDRRPIARFLREVESIRNRFKDTQQPDQPRTDLAPFTITLTLIDARGNQVGQPTQIRPSAKTTSVTLPKGSTNSIRLDVRPDPFWKFVSGKMEGSFKSSDGGVTPGDAVQPGPSVNLGGETTEQSLLHSMTFGHIREFPNSSIEFRMTGWRAQTLFASEDDPALGSDQFFLRVNLGDANVNETSLDLSTMSFSAVNLAEVPCPDGACPPGGSNPPRTGRSHDTSGSIRGDATRNPSSGTLGAARVLPWLDPDPSHPSSPGDPKVLLLTALGTWLAQMLVRERAGTADEIGTARRLLAELIYRLAWVFLFGVPTEVDSSALGAMIRRLLEGWCDELLWKGPECCGEPHGVVIATVIVGAGRIQKIDPFEGRRHVIHYPLLEHWGAQFGLAPLDVTASRLFSKICCLASLRDVTTDEFRDGFFTRVPVGAGVLVASDPNLLFGRLSKTGLTIRGQRRVSLPEFVAEALRVMRMSRVAGGKEEYTALILDDVVAAQTVVLLVPASS